MMFKKRASIGLLALFLGLIFSARGFSESSAPHYLMVALGDSISAGSYANTSLSSFKDATPPQGFAPNFLLQWVKEWFIKKYVQGNRETLSWSVGNQLHSHYYFLQEYLKKNEPTAQLTAINLAVPGAVVSKVEAQVDQLISGLQSGRFTSLKYVTLMAGANDTCQTDSRSQFPMAEFQRAYARVFTKLASIQQKEPIHVLIMAIPRIPDLATPLIRNSHTVASVTCGWVMDHVMKYCPRHLQLKTNEEYRARLHEIEQMNEVIAATSKAASLHFSNLQIAFSAFSFANPVQPRFLAADCFHPNASGQQQLALKSWDEQPWYKAGMK